VISRIASDCIVTCDCIVTFGGTYLIIHKVILIILKNGT